MLLKTIKTGYLFLSAIFFFIVGILMLNFKNDFLEFLIYFFSIGLFFKSFISLLFSNERKKSFIGLIYSIVLIGIGKNVIYILSFIFSIYFFLLCIVDIINYILFFKNNIKGKIKIVCNIFLNLFFSIFLLYKSKYSIEIILLVVGIYFLIVSVDYFISFVLEVIPMKILNIIKRKIKIPLPEFIVAFIPQRLIKLVNKKFMISDLSEKYDFSKSEDSDLQIIIHLAKSGSAKMGHVEVSFEGKIYSYGNYDMHSRSFFESIGDGVILIVDKDKYIDYCVNHKDRYLVEFGISLTEKEKRIIRKNIDDLVNNNTIDYYSDAQLVEQKKLVKDDLSDMSSEIYLYAGGRFKKIIKGKYKKFYVVRCNCAVVVGSILKSIGESVISVNGIITPGAYYEYLNHKFRLKNSNVVSRKIYYKNN